MWIPRWSPGYTSAVHRIARGLIDSEQIGRLRPTAVLVSSETLTPSARADIESAFGCRVTNAYSLGELVAFVSECEHGELHVSTEYGVIELLEGAAGTEIVATGLINKGMPLLRYRTSDLATAGRPLPVDCGRGLPVLSDLVGRVDDVVHTPEGATVGPAPMSLAFQRVPRLRRAQVRQDDTDELVVLVEVDPVVRSRGRGRSWWASCVGDSVRRSASWWSTSTWCPAPRAARSDWSSPRSVGRGTFMRRRLAPAVSRVVGP